jgi:hypothetical protein
MRQRHREYLAYEEGRVVRSLAAEPTFLDGTSSRIALNLTRRQILLVSAAATAFMPSGRSLSQSRKVIYDVPLIAQETSMSCWAAAIAMIVSWARGEEITPLEVARDSNRIQAYETGLDPLDAELFDRWGMMTVAPQTFTAEGFLDLLAEFGPIWVAGEVFAPHVRVATGFELGTPSYAGAVHINDPLENGLKRFQPSNTGSKYKETYVEFVQNNERLGTEELKDQSLEGSRYPVYFAHLRRKPRST